MEYRLLSAALGIGVGLFAPRFPRASLTTISGLLTIPLTLILLIAGEASIGTAAAACGLAMAATILLAGRTPRLALALPLLLGMAVAVLTLTRGFGVVRLSAAVVAVLLLVLGIVKPRFGLRLTASILGASLVWGLGPWASNRWLWAATVIALVVAGRPARAESREESTDERKGRVWPAAILGGASVALVLLGVCGALPELGPAAEGTPQARRMSQLREALPSGGAVWALPSEALLWDAEGFPAFENLDALYLGGDPAGGPVKLAGTSLLRGRLFSNRRLHRMRAIKDEEELEHLRRALEATVESLRQSLHLVRHGGSEAAVAEALRSQQRRLGCEGDSFPPIVASGTNALEIHYDDNDDPLEHGELLLVDTGCYVRHYAADFARTLPVGGTFAPRERELYEALKEAAQSAARACRPGVFLRGRKARGGGKTLEMIARETLEARGVASDFPHGLGHPIGLFVHDVFSLSRPLEAGMVVMIEPGLYLEQEGLGMRIEDAYLVTEEGCELLTHGFPSDPDAIERELARARP